MPGTGTEQKPSSISRSPTSQHRTRSGSQPRSWRASRETNPSRSAGNAPRSQPATLRASFDVGRVVGRLRSERSLPLQPKNRPIHGLKLFAFWNNVPIIEHCSENGTHEDHENRPCLPHHACRRHVRSGRRTT